ncbi:hypothetical protein [Amaricoccus sp.]|uniref:hypothetical protein n=1 Tax=Amaricoccus sp. TaxID=1872485 RepID=UPI001B6B94E5|nr:hypothetical protein [Amaricoccus sp.]MBP7003409.1 hypothetical protein [Amaricoccus sp.]
MVVSISGHGVDREAARGGTAVDRLGHARRVEAVELVADDVAVLPDVGLAEQNDQWAVQRYRHTTLVADDPIVALPLAD